MSKKILFLSTALIIGVSFFVGAKSGLAADASGAALASSTQPSITGVSGSTSLQVGETGTWQVKINYPVSTMDKLSFYVSWGDEQTPPMPPIYVGPNTASGAEDAAKFSHVYNVAGIYHPTFTVTNQNNRSVYTRVNVNVGSVDQLSILSPNGGETYKNDGSPITVNWQTNNVPASHVIDIIRLRAYPNGREYNLATNVLNDGQEVIPIPSSVPVGAYILEIKTYVGETLVMDSSDSYFKIVDSNGGTAQSSITVLSPNGGESYLSADNFVVVWSAFGAEAFPGANLQLINYSTGKVESSVRVNPSSGTWKTETLKLSGLLSGKYIIKACLSGNIDVCDSSNSYFTITAPTTTATCDDLKSSQTYYYNICSSGGFENVCFDKYSGAYQSCTNNSNNDCTVSNIHASQNILCPTITSSAAMAKEQVKCVFNNSTAEQKCYTAGDNSRAVCAGTVSCLADISGYSGEKITWKSSCGGYAYTIMDGSSEYAIFNCPTPAIVSPATPATINPTTTAVGEKAEQILDINEKSKLLSNDNFDYILAELDQLRSLVKEQQTQIKYLSSLVKDVQALSEKAQAAINNFITYGVDANTQKLGAGERAAVMNSYKAAFDKLPETEAELADAIKIANGRFPSVTSADAEKTATNQFIKIYKRAPDLNNANDNAAIKVMAYGLRQKAENRNLTSEQTGIKIFKSIFGKTPTTTEDWNTMQAITYSGATR